jgi:hypothetical protein
MRKILHLLFILLLIFQGAAKAQDRIYWGVNGSDANISSAQLDGSDIRKSASVTTRQGYDMETDFYKKILYFGDGAYVKKCNLDGSDMKTIYTATSGWLIGGLALDLKNNKLYYSQFQQSVGIITIFRSNLDGTGIEPIITSTAGQTYNLAISQSLQKLYWTVANGATTTVYRSNLDGTGVETLASLGAFVPGICIDEDNQKLYLAYWQNNEVRSTDMTCSTAPTLLFGASNGTFQMSVSNVENKLYFGEMSTYKIRRCNLDGSSPQDIVSGLSGQIMALSIPTVPPAPTIYANETYTFELNDFIFASVDKNSLTKIKITALANKGTIYLDANNNNVVDAGEAVALNQEIPRADLVAGKLKFDPVTNEYGSPYTTFTFNWYNGSSYYTSDYLQYIYVQSIAPTVTTQAVSDIGSTTATGNGNITNLGVPFPTSYGICWNTTGSPTTSNSKVDLGATSATGAFTAAITGLAANTTYKARAYAVNEAGTSYGAEVSFTTAAVPTISGISHTSGTIVGGTSVTITGTNLTGATAVKFGSANATSYAVNSATQITAVSPAGSAGAVDITVTTAGGTSATSSADQFTYVAAPTASSAAASIITNIGATLNGSINANNASTTVTFEYGLTTGYGTTVTPAQSPVTGTTATAVNYALSGLTPNSTYHYRVVGVNAGGTTNGTDLTFTTSATNVPTESFYEQITLPFAPTDDVDMSSSTLAPTMNLASAGSYPSKGYKVTLLTSGTITLSASSNTITTSAFAFLVSTSPDASSSSRKYIGVGNGTTAPLTPGTYYIILLTDNKYGKFKLNITFAALPNITSISPTSGSIVGGTTVTITGTNLTGATAVKFGSTNTTSFTVNSATQITAVSPAGSAGAVDITVTTAGVTSTTSSGDQFTYVAPPTATTNAATIITSTGATLNGSVNANNASTTVTFEYGSTTSYGTSVTADQSPVTGSSATAVSYALSGLTPNTTYHYRVVGVNGGGTTYGADQTFTTQYAPQTISFGVLDNKTYGDAPYDLAATSTSGLPVSYSSDNTAVATVSGTTVTIVGAGTANIRATQEGNASYGAATPVSQILTVNALPVTITANAGQSKVYSDTDPTLTYTVSPALIGTDAFTGTLSRTAGENVGNYAISQGSLSAGSNYTLSFIANDLAITPKAITVTANAATKVYGEADPTLTYTVFPALVGTDAFSGALSRTTGENVGNYAIAQGTLSAGSNYALSFVPKDFAITPKAITVTANAGQTKVYGEADPTLTYTVSPVLVGTDAFTGALSRATGENIGNYAISQGSLSAGSNYTLSFISNDLAITPKAITVTVNAATKVYGEADPTLTYKASSVIGTDTFTGALSRATGENVGNYAILQGSLSAGSNYTLSFISNDLAITPKQLATTSPSVATSKLYDGSTRAQVVSLGSLTGAIASDIPNLSLSAVANYNDASVGNDKTITIIYTLSGSAASNYLTPAPSVIPGASIQDNITLATLSTPSPSCQGDDVLLNYQVLSGNPDTYTLTFGSQALAAGFSNKENIPVPSFKAFESITIKVPAGIAGGTYTANLKMKGKLGNESPSYPFTFTINLSTDYLITKFNDVILFDNKSNRFNAFQWYKNGFPIQGATKQFYNDPDGLSGSYSVAVTTTNGEKLRTCDKVIVRTTPTKSKISVYPNPIKRNESSIISFSGIEKEEIESSTLVVYKMSGEKVYTNEHMSMTTQLRINLPAGIYIGNVVTSDKEVYSFKVVIE